MALVTLMEWLPQTFQRAREVSRFRPRRSGWRWRDMPAELLKVRSAQRRPTVQLEWSRLRGGLNNSPRAPEGMRPAAGAGEPRAEARRRGGLTTIGEPERNALASIRRSRQPSAYVLIRPSSSLRQPVLPERVLAHRSSCLSSKQSQGLDLQPRRWRFFEAYLRISPAVRHRDNAREFARGQMRGLLSGRNTPKHSPLAAMSL